MTSAIAPRSSRRNNERHLSPFSYEEATTLFNLNPSRDLKSTRCTNIQVDTTPGAPPLDVQRRQKCEQVRQYFHVTMELFEKIFEHMVGEEAYTVQPIHKLRHPMIFYIGHTATFYMNKLAVAGLAQRINPKFEEMFATGVDEMSWDDLNESHYSWPAAADVWRYRSQVRIAVDEMFEKYLKNGSGEGMPLPLNFANSTSDSAHTFFWAVLMGIEHERIHIETASVHLRELPLKYVSSGSKFWAPYPYPNEDDNGKPAPKNELVKVLSERVEVPVGRDPESPFFGWDVDYSKKGFAMPCEPFSASKYLVSNEEFFEFMQDGGYTNKQWWDEEGWKWVSWKKPEHPWFWIKSSSSSSTSSSSKSGGSDDQQSRPSYKLRVQVDEIPLPWTWPAEVNHLEARAFCNWKSSKTGKKLRLPTEREWLVMWDKFVKVDQGDWKEKSPPGNINFDYQWASSCPVDKFQHGPLFDVVGNVWQHLETPNYPYPGYRVHPLYDDFSMPTFDGRHMMMRGGAWISTGNEASRDARFSFRRHFFQCVGIRYVEGGDIDEKALNTSILGMDPMVDTAAQKAYLSNVPALAGAEHFGEKAAKFIIAAYKRAFGDSAPLPQRSLEVQCGAGRITFELSQHVLEALGTDFTARNLQPAFAMRERAHTDFSVVANPVSGERKSVHVKADDFAWSSSRERAFFYQSDPANLHAHLDNFDLICGLDTLSHTYKPTMVPAHLISRLNKEKGGIVVLFEPHDAGTSAVSDETLGSVQKQPRPSSHDVCEMLKQGGATEILPIQQVTFDICDGVVSAERVGITRLTLDAIVAVVRV